MHTELRDALEFLYVDSVVAARPCRAVTIDVARGGTGSVHVLLNGISKGGKIHLTVRSGGQIVRNHEWFRLIDVPVEVNTGPVAFVEKKGEQNPFVARRAPFRVYDAMEPTGCTIIASSPSMALRLHLPVAKKGETAHREYTVEIEHGRETHTLRVTLNIHKTTIPAVGKRSFPYTNWFSFNLMAQRHGLEPWSEAHWQMIRRYADLMVHARQNTFWVPLSDIFSVRRKVAVLDRKRLRRIVRVFTDAGMYFIEGGHVAGRTGGDWNATTFDIGLTQARATSAEGNAHLAHITRQLMDQIHHNGWHERWIQHVTDEPTEANATDYRILVGMVRRYMPGLPILDATMALKLVGSVDIWCPQAQEYQKHRRQFDALRAFGDRVWFYTCCSPGGPWLNRLLDMELLRPALLGWGAALFNLEGFLHWGLNHYRPRQDPFRTSVVGHGGGNFLPAGDTHIVYPVVGQPWSSLRLEAQREGLEDCELLLRLRRQDEELACKIIRKAIRGFDKYTKNVRTFRDARRQLLETLDGDVR